MGASALYLARPDAIMGKDPKKAGATMSILSQKDQDYLRETFQKELVREVTVVLFSQFSKLTVPGRECQYCPETNQLMQEVAALTDKIKLETYDLYQDEAKAQEYGVDHVPAIILTNDGARNVRYYGIPAGNEFPNFLEAVTHLSKGGNALSPQAQEEVKSIDEDLHVQVFVTPT